MKATSFLLGIVLIFGANQVRQVFCSDAAAQQVLATLQQPTGCDPLKVRLACFQKKFRTFDGTCNNLCRTDLGSAGSAFRRFEGLDPPTDYEPGFQPRIVSAIPSKNLSNCRQISVEVLSSTNLNVNETNATAGTNAPDFTHLTMTWGQFLDHDITLTPMTEVECGINNEPCPQRAGCIGIDIPSDQRLQFNESAECIPLRRSEQDEAGEQLNDVTTYIDGSQVYGSDSELAIRLRGNRTKGQLDVRPFLIINQFGILPPADEEAFCRSPNREEENCFIAGDVRVNENQALMAMHTLWVREHNRIAKALAMLNPTWGDERLFQEARKIVGAELQHITYNEWLAVLFNENLREREGLLLEQNGTFFTQYDPARDPGIVNSFATAALRMGHTLIRNEFNLLNPHFRRRDFGQPNAIETRDYFNPARLFDTGVRSNNPYSGILLGLTGIRAQQVDGHFVEAVRERLIFEGPTIDGIVGDLPAINCQRGRDHGLPGYVKFREACGGKPAKFFSDLLDTTTQAQINLLKRVYTNVLDIDLFVGAIVEFPTGESALGFTFTCMLARQFKDLRFADRFWYERDDHQTAFTLAQLTEIRKTSIARVICDNADLVKEIHKEAFLPRTGSNGNNPLVPCESIDRVNLNVFRDGSGVESSGPGGAEGEGNTAA